MKKIYYAFLFFIISLFTTCGLSTFVFADTAKFDPNYRGSSTGDYITGYDPNELAWLLCFTGVAEPHERVPHGWQDNLGFGNRKIAFFENNSDYTVYYVVFCAPASGGWSAQYQLLYSPDLTTLDGSISARTVCYNEELQQPYASLPAYSNCDYYFSQPNYPFYSAYSGYPITLTSAEFAYELLISKVFPSVDVADPDLDIHGLLASAANTQYVGDSNNSSNIGWRDFVQGVINLLPDSITGFFNTDLPFKNNLGYVQTTVPGIQMTWDSPEVSNITNYDDPYAINYTIWADGHSSAQVTLRGYTYNDSCNFRQLQLRSGPIVYNQAYSSYYNTNTDYKVILNYFLTNANFGNGVNDNTLNQTVFNTTFSRIYIQASKLDEDGNTHKGAVSYVDFSTGHPVVHEGVTDTIEDITPSDSDEGVTNTVTQDYTVSGDNIYYGDTITNNNITNNYGGGGLVIGDGVSFLSAGLALINAILELIKLLFASLLIPLITLGWTGHF